MKILSKLATVTLLATALGGTAAADNKPTAASTLKEIEGAFGFVPAFVKALPSTYLLAVAAATPCEYCIYFHTEAAKLNGATDQEIQEAVAMAGLTRLGSTVLNGM